MGGLLGGGGGGGKGYVGPPLSNYWGGGWPPCPPLPTPMLENSFCQPSSKWVPFTNQRKIRRKEGDGPSLLFNYAQDAVGLLLLKFYKQSLMIRYV